MRKLFILALFLPVIAWGQASLPPCQGEYLVAEWNNCIGTSVFADGKRYTGEFGDNAREGLGILYNTLRSFSGISNNHMPFGRPDNLGFSEEAWTKKYPFLTTENRVFTPPASTQDSNSNQTAGPIFDPKAELSKRRQLSDSQFEKAVEASGGIGEFLRGMSGREGFASMVGQRVDERTTILSVDVDVPSLTVKRVFRVTGSASLNQLQRSRFQAAVSAGNIEELCSTPSNRVLIKVYGVSFITEHVDDELRVLSSFVANRQNCSRFLENVGTTPSKDQSLPLTEKFESRGHAKAKGVLLSVEYPKGWKASDGETPNILQTFTGTVSGSRIQLSVQIRDTGLNRNIEQDCQLTTEQQWKALFSNEAQGNLVQTVQKVVVEQRPAAIIDLTTKVQRLDVTLQVFVKQMVVCYKDKFVMLSVFSGSEGTTHAAKTGSNNIPEEIWRRFFNSLILIEN